MKDSSVSERKIHCLWENSKSDRTPNTSVSLADAVSRDATSQLMEEKGEESSAGSAHKIQTRPRVGNLHGNLLGSRKAIPTQAWDLGTATRFYKSTSPAF